MSTPSDLQLLLQQWGADNADLLVQSNLVIRNFLVTLKLFLNAKCSSLCRKLAIGHWKWFLNTNLFLIKTFLITKFDLLSNGKR
jgi:hypothetical protein